MYSNCEGDALVSVVDNKIHRRLEFDLPRYKRFLKLNRFFGYNSGKGWSNIQQYLKKDPVQINKIYKFAKLDQYSLHDTLNDLPDAELKALTPTDLKYPWVLTNILKERKLG